MKAYISKLKNRRVRLRQTDSGDFVIWFTKLNETPEDSRPTCTHETYRDGKITRTGIKMSEEALQAIVAMYNRIRNES